MLVGKIKVFFCSAISYEGINLYCDEDYNTCTSFLLYGSILNCVYIDFYFEFYLYTFSAKVNFMSVRVDFIIKQTLKNIHAHKGTTPYIM